MNLSMKSLIFIYLLETHNSLIGLEELMIPLRQSCGIVKVSFYALATSSLIVWKYIISEHHIIKGGTSKPLTNRISSSYLKGHPTSSSNHAAACLEVTWHLALGCLDTQQTWVFLQYMVLNFKLNACTVVWLGLS